MQRWAAGSYGTQTAAARAAVQDVLHGSGLHAMSALVHGSCSVAARGWAAALLISWCPMVLQESWRDRRCAADTQSEVQSGLPMWQQAEARREPSSQGSAVQLRAQCSGAADCCCLLISGQLPACDHTAGRLAARAPPVAASAGESRRSSCSAAAGAVRQGCCCTPSRCYRRTSSRPSVLQSDLPVTLAGRPPWWQQAAACQLPCSSCMHAMCS